MFFWKSFLGENLAQNLKIIKIEFLFKNLDVGDKIQYYKKLIVYIFVLVRKDRKNAGD